jgi:hypothetical protein
MSDRLLLSLTDVTHARANPAENVVFVREKC